MKLKNKRREQAAQLLADDRLKDNKIAELCGIHETTLSQWKRRPDIKSRIEELTQAYADKALKTGLALRERRIAELWSRHDKFRQIIEERAADPSLVGVPGGNTGLVVRSTKVVGKQVYESFSTDTRLSKEMRGIEEQIARELGQWQERIEVEDVSLADVLAKARARKPQPQAEAIVVEQEIPAPASDLPN